MSKYFIVFLLMFCAAYASAMDSDLALRPGEIETISKGELLVQPVPLLVKAVKKNHLLRDKERLHFDSKPLLKKNNNKKDEESNLSEVVFNPQNPLKLNETLYSNRLHTLISPRANLTSASFDKLLTQVPTLEVVDFSGNKIGVVSGKELHAIANAKHIRMINLSGNVITSLESSLLKWRKGNHDLLLNLNGNAISPEECTQIQQSIALSPLDSIVAKWRGVLYSGAVGAGALGIGYLTARTIEETALTSLVDPAVETYLPQVAYYFWKVAFISALKGTAFVYKPLKIVLKADDIVFGGGLTDKAASKYAEDMGCSEELQQTVKDTIKETISDAKNPFILKERWENPGELRKQAVNIAVDCKQLKDLLGEEVKELSYKDLSCKDLSYMVEALDYIPGTKEEAEKKLQGCEQIYCASYHGTALLVGLGSYFALKKAFQHDYGHYDKGYKSTRILLNDQESIKNSIKNKILVVDEM